MAFFFCEPTLPRATIKFCACGGSSFDDAGLKACGQLQHLTDLQIWHTPITDVGVAHLTKLPSLQNLRLLSQWKPRITDDSFVHVAALRSLESLTIGETRFSWHSGLYHLNKLPNLTFLNLHEVDISEQELDQLKTELPKLRVEWTPIAEKRRETFERNWSMSKVRPYKGSSP